MTTQITVDQETYPGITVAYAQHTRYIDAAEIQVLGNELWALVEGKNNPQFIFSMRGVIFLASPALNKLIILDKKCKAAGGQWTICNLHPDVMEVFVITRLNQWFNFDPDLATALKRFAAPVPA